VSRVVLFRRLAVVTTLFAYLQIALGGLVRVSGSGLGCPDWPLCQGRPYPPANVHAIIEYSHRTVGGITGVLVIATVVGAWLVFRSRRPLVAWFATASLVAIAVEAAIGGLVVATELPPWIVAVHLGLAMVILGFLLASAVLSMPASNGVPDLTFRRLAISATAGTYLMLLSGSSVVASGAGASCNTWPLCGNGFAFDFAGANAYTMLHRGAVLVVGLLLLHVLSTAVRRWRAVGGMGPMAGAAIGVFVLQVAVGAGSAVAGGGFFDGLHVALATLVWAGVLGTALLTLPRPDVEPGLTRPIVGSGSA
jgi:heme A synthase